MAARDFGASEYQHHSPLGEAAIAFFISILTRVMQKVENIRRVLCYPCAEFKSRKLVAVDNQATDPSSPHGLAFSLRMPHPRISLLGFPRKFFAVSSAKQFEGAQLPTNHVSRAFVKTQSNNAIDSFFLGVGCWRCFNRSRPTPFLFLF